MRIPLAGRIVIYLVVFACVLDLFMHLLGISGSRFPASAPFSSLFFPIAMALLLGLSVGRIYEKAYWPGSNISLTRVGPGLPDVHLEHEPLTSAPPETYSPQPAFLWQVSIGLGMLLLGIAGLTCVDHWTNAEGGNYRNEFLILDLAFWSSLFFVLGGIGLIAVSTRQRIRQALVGRTRLKLYERTRYHYFPKLHRTLLAKFSKLPSFGLVATVIVGYANILYLALPSGRYPRMGINVFLVPERVSSHTSARSEPFLIVRVTPDRHWRPRYYLNSKPIPREQLSTALEAELKLRAEWVVYIDGDRDLPWETAADVMDVVQGLHAKVAVRIPQAKDSPRQRAPANYENRR